MSLLEAQVSANFDDTNQMVIHYETRIQLKYEEIDTLEDLVEFDEVSISKISGNFIIPGGRVSDLNPGAVAECYYSSTFFYPRSEGSATHSSMPCSKIL